jgi:class 3 adenylate cyclase
MGVVILATIFVIPFGGGTSTLYGIVSPMIKNLNVVQSSGNAATLAYDYTWIVGFILLLIAGIVGIFPLGTGVLGMVGMAMITASPFAIYPNGPYTLSTGTGFYTVWIASVVSLVASRWHGKKETPPAVSVTVIQSPNSPQQPVESSQPTRRLAAIMFTDIVGYTALTQTDEAWAMKLLEKHRNIIRPIFQKYSGREVKTIGDAFLVEFHSALEATECAVEMQKTVHEYDEPPEDKVKLKIGIHVGDVIHKDGDVLGDAVNIASRIEPLAVGGGFCISEQVYDQIRNKVPYNLVKLEPKELKNVSFQIDTYRVEPHPESSA